MTPEEIAQDRAVIAATTGGTWATYSPREQGGGPTIGCFGTTVDTPDALVQIRQSRPAPKTDAEFAALVREADATPWAQHEANARFAVVAHERWPMALDALAEMRRRIADVDALRAKFKTDADDLDDQGVYTKAMVPREKEWLLDEVLRILRGGK